MAKLFSIRPTLTFKGRKFKGLRGWAGKPFHPPLTDIPIGAYIIAAIFDVISYAKGEGDLAQTLFRAATYVLIVGLIVTVPTALTGFWDWLKSTPKGTQARRTANWHMAVMLTTTAVVLVNVLVRLGDHDAQPATSFGLMALTVVIAGLVALGASYGGTLVYEYEFNVEQDKGWAWEESETDVYPDGTRR
jgi:uncharacterized membrane protein